MKPKKLCQRCGDPATWYSNISGEDLCTPHYNAAVETVSPARPMRPWKWDAVGFKAVQEEQRSPSWHVEMFNALAQRECERMRDSFRSPRFIPSAFLPQPVQPLQGSTLLRMFGFPF